MYATSYHEVGLCNIFAWIGANKSFRIDLTHCASLYLMTGLFFVTVLSNPSVSYSFAHSALSFRS